ncbi:phosphotransferase [Streptomyces polygonati]|uniref:Phosphotransferase n=1 Tax=Streptomyces polygonati TaxID=1617087 RepID=A0ABV8HHG2_9ACTN
MLSGVPLSDALRAEFGAVGRARRIGSSPRSRVWAVTLGDTPVVVKQSVGGPEAQARFAREVTALRVAGRAGVRVAAPLLGVDEQARVMVLGRIEGGPPGAGWAVAYARALARLHATGRPEDAGGLPVWAGPTQADVEAFCGFAGALGVPVGAGARAELTAAVERLAAEAAGGHALLHGDPCPGNDLYTADGPVFVDFEGAALGSGSVELAYLRIGFPTCWGSMALRPAELAAAEGAYADSWRQVTGTEVSGDPADACLGWLIRGDALVPCAKRGTRDHLARAARRDWRWGPPSARERLRHRLAVVSDLGVGHPRIRRVGDLTAVLHHAVSTRWPGLEALPASRDPRAD